MNSGKIKEQVLAFKLYAEGQTPKEIALQVGVTPATIRRWGKEFSWPQKLTEMRLEGQPEHFRKLAEETKQQADSKHKRGIQLLKEADRLYETYRILTQNF